MDNTNQRNSNTNESTGNSGTLDPVSFGSPKSAQPTQVIPTSEQEFGSGKPQPAEYGYDVPEDGINVDVPNPGPTNGLTDYSSLTDQQGEVWDGDATSFAGSRFAPLADNTEFTLQRGTYISVNPIFTAKKPIPFALFRGTDGLLPFGASYTYHTIMGGSAAITELGQLSLPGLNEPSNSLRAVASLRETNNYKAFAEMQDAIISYRSRSIAYTNLSVEDMFALELSRESCLGGAALCLYGSKIAREYVNTLNKRGLKFSTKLQRALADPDVGAAELNLYNALCEHKTFDDTFWTRLAQLCKLRVSSKRTGQFPTFIMRDVTVPTLGMYNISEKSGQYDVITTHLGATAWGAAGTPYSLLDWVVTFLALGTRSSSNYTSVKNAVIQKIDNLTEMVNAVKQYYRIITGAIDTIEANRGAKFHHIDEFLPCNGMKEVKGNFFIDYILEDPSFSYAYKERIEHAPQVAVGEKAGGTNGGIYVFNLATIGKPFSRLSGMSSADTTFIRPVGLYKGDNAWMTDEIVAIGVYRQGAGNTIFTPAEVSGILANYTGSPIVYGTKAGGAGTSLTLNGFTADADITNIMFVDAIMGDFYSTATPFYGAIPAASSSMAKSFVTSDVVEFATMNRQSSSAAAYVSSMPILGPITRVATPPTTTDGGYSLLSAKDSATNASVIYLPGWVSNQVDPSHTYANADFDYWVYTQLDVSTLPLRTVKLVTGEQDSPTLGYVGYRGAYWYEFTLTTLENTVIAMSDKFAMTYKNAAAARETKYNTREANTNNR